jgi:hypothetical protein
MAYFANGTEGELYYEAFCSRCANFPHDDDTRDCPIRSVHFFYNYDQNSNKELAGALSLLIPRSKDGLENEQCKMFRPLPEWAA